MRLPLRHQILLPMVGILLLTVAVVSALNAWLASKQIQGQLETRLDDVAQTLSSTNFPLEANVLRQTRGLTGAEYVVADAAGTPLAASDDALLDLAANLGSGPQPLDLSHLVDNRGNLYFHAVVPLDRRPAGGGRAALHVFYPEAAWREARWQAVWPPLTIGGLAILLVALAAAIVASHVTRPIHQLIAQSNRIARGDFTPVPLPARDDEVRDLAAAVNQMAGKLASYELETRKGERLRTLGTLGGGIAHQIRNAATGCRIALDLHERDCPLAATNEQNGHADDPLAVAARQLELIETHLRRFLTLGQNAAVERQPLDLNDPLTEAVTLVEPMANHVGVTIAAQRSHHPARISGDRQALVQMLVNLLVNAIEATAKTRVAVGIGPSEGQRLKVIADVSDSGQNRQIAVVDPGPGPSVALQSRLFEPFATDKPGGTGLGLVVSRQIAEDHGGTLHWERRDEQTWFIVSLPGDYNRES